MRTVSFSNRQVQDVLNNEFVCCYTNTKGDPSAGASFSHAPSDQPGPCGRGAGRQNVQTLFLTPDGEIFHVVTGFLEAKDLLDEIQFARQLFADLLRSDKHDAQIVVSAHRKQLEKLGFTTQQIAAPQDQLSEMLLSGLNPQDLGINVPKPQDFGISFGGPMAGLFGDIGRQRTLTDHKFVMAHPLMTHQAFEENPESLVGRHKSFFGSHSAMNGISQQVNQQLNRATGLPLQRRR